MHRFLVEKGLVVCGLWYLEGPEMVGTVFGTCACAYRPGRVPDRTNLQTAPRLRLWTANQRLRIDRLQ